MLRILFLILLFLPGNVYAENGEGFSDYAIAGTIKVLAKAYVQTVDLDKVKARQIKALLKMKEVKFQKRYAEIYTFLKKVPPGLRLRYGFVEQMSKEKAVKGIQRLDKNDLMEIIDGIPDGVIVKCVKNYLRQKAYRLKDNTLLQQIDSMWEEFIRKA